LRSELPTQLTRRSITVLRRLRGLCVDDEALFHGDDVDGVSAALTGLAHRCGHPRERVGVEARNPRLDTTPGGIGLGKIQSHALLGGSAPLRSRDDFPTNDAGRNSMLVVQRGGSVRRRVVTTRKRRIGAMRKRTVNGNSLRRHRAASEQPTTKTPSDEIAARGSKASGTTRKEGTQDLCQKRSL
jgi:hypothetical protein